MDKLSIKLDKFLEIIADRPMFLDIKKSWRQHPFPFMTSVFIHVETIGGNSIVTDSLPIESD